MFCFCMLALSISSVCDYSIINFLLLSRCVISRYECWWTENPHCSLKFAQREAFSSVEHLVWAWDFASSMAVCCQGQSIACLITSLAIVSTLLLECLAQHYTNQWAVHVEGGEDVAKRLAEQHGFTYVDKVLYKLSNNCVVYLQLMMY